MDDFIYSIGVIPSVHHKKVTDIRNITWNELAPLLTHHLAREVKDGTAWLPGISTVGPRTKSRASPWVLLPLDIEKKNDGPQPPEVNDLAAEIQRLGLQCAIATSYSHRAEYPRYRVIFPLSRALTFDEIKPLACVVAGMIGCGECWDKATTDPARAFYLPSCPLDNIAFAVGKIVEGDVINVDECLLKYSKSAIENVPEKSDIKKNKNKSDLVVRDENLDDLSFISPEKQGLDQSTIKYLLNFLDPDSDYETWFRILAAIHFELGENDGRKVALEWSKCGNKFVDENDFDKSWGYFGKPNVKRYVTGKFLIKSAFPSGIPKCTIIGNARRIHMYYLKRLMRVAETNQWYWWSGNFWEKITEAEVNDKGRLVIEEMSKEAKLHSSPVDFMKWCYRSAQRGWIPALQTLGDMPGVLVKADSLDKHPNLLGVKNGAVDLSSGALLAPNPNLRIVNCTGVMYNKDAKCEVFEKVVSDAFYGDQEMIVFFRRALGYSILANPKEELIFIPFGSGANGKSKIFSAVMEAMGDYAKNCSSETLLDSSYSSSSAGKPREDIVRLKGARILLASEPEEGAYFREALVKSMTGGDKITARTIYGKESIEIFPTWVTWMPTNHKPIVKGNDYGIWRRICLIPFTRDMKNDPEINHDPNLSKKLSAEKEGILKYLIEAAKEYLVNGLDIPRKISDATNLYREDMDITAEWIAECCEVGAQYESTSRELWLSWKAFAEERGLLRLIPSDISLARRLQSRFPAVRRSKGLRCRIGICVRQTPNDNTIFASVDTAIISTGENH